MIGVSKQITCPYCRRPGILMGCYYGICEVKHEDRTCYVYDVHLLSVYNPEDLEGVPMVDYWEDYEEEEDLGEGVEGEGLEEALGEDFWEDVRRELEELDRE